MTRPTSEQFRALFDPKGVVVAGASSHPGKFGFVSLHNILACGYEGRVFGTNRQGEEVLGLRTVVSLDDIPDGAVGGHGGGEQLDGGRPHGVSRPDAEPHETALGLVCDGVTTELHGDGETDPLGRLGRLIGRGHDVFLQHGNAVTTHELLRRGFREGRRGHPETVPVRC